MTDESLGARGVLPADNRVSDGQGTRGADGLDTWCAWCHRWVPLRELVDHTNVHDAQALPPDQERLYGTSDAMVWAEEFCRTFQVSKFGHRVADGEGLMASWFANAMMTAIDHDNRRKSAQAVV